MKLWRKKKNRLRHPKPSPLEIIDDGDKTMVIDIDVDERELDEETQVLVGWCIFCEMGKRKNGKGKMEGHQVQWWVCWYEGKFYDSYGQYESLEEAQDALLDLKITGRYDYDYN